MPTVTPTSTRPQQSNSSVLIQVNLPERNLTACLIDPFIPLLRGFEPGLAHSVTRPPTKPYIASSASSLKTGPSCFQPDRNAPSVSLKPYNRLVSRDTSASVPCSDHLPVQFAGKARPQHHAYDPSPNSEATHHASIEPDISAAVEVIRARWIETEQLRGHPEWWAEDHDQNENGIHDRVRLRLHENKYKSAFNSGGPKWADITRRRLPRSGLAELTHVNLSPESMRLVSLSENYDIHLPPKSGFSLSLLEEFSQVVPRLKHVDGWDAIVIDPPWENKSASRGSKYESVELYDLFKLQLPQMLGENGHKRALVAIWVTNRPKFRRFLMSKFMPDSHIVGPYAEWYWVKITASPVENGQRLLSEGGKPIFNLASVSPRRCYEGLILGWYTPSSLRSTNPMETLPLKKVFLSTPLDHSRKPNLADLLQPYLPPGANFLELFARTASSLKIADRCCQSNDMSRSDELAWGFWHSIGDESPKFNGSPWVEKCPRS
ncbi:hypothetical protein CROQUDRAFT_66226 [Cronartium quercuum f. sp. fusiforme G11]|uniref:MT-A70-domain-containing protein n=1 Tax=Cronartium quercuum f. sp. fusiforme G11 TaxID=708437 RepID=A0A9P6T9A0_9BASI|nr:hypothetical protein CROQUDRAFT_66226 [Cronartium quercuum f. sp. fusiforme G11]